MTRLLVMFIILAVLLTQGWNSFAERANELGVVDYFAQYKWKSAKHTTKYAQEGKRFLVTLKGMEINSKMVAPSIFNSDQKEKRDAYKRIFIPWYCYVFSMEQYKGMEEFVKSGGLLVTSSGLSLLDTNNDNMMDGDKETRFPTKTFLGVDASWVFNIKKVKLVNSESVLAANIEIKGSVPLVVGGRKGVNVSAEIIMSDEGLIYKKELSATFLSVKSYGKGACVFIAVPLSRPNVMKKFPVIEKLAINCFSKEAYEELCVP